MPTIAITDLQPTGSELFTDAESYLQDITDDSLMIRGGAAVVPFPTPLPTPTSPASISLATVVSLLSITPGR